MDTVAARQLLNERQEQMKAEEGQRRLPSPRDEWAATLPNAWKLHVWTEKEDLKKSFIYFTNLLKGFQKNCCRLERFADKREQNSKLRFISDINDEDYDSLLFGMEKEQVKFPFNTIFSSLKRDLKRLIEECAEEKRTAITMCENIADIEGKPKYIPLKAWHLLDCESKQFVMRVHEGIGSDEAQIQNISQGLVSLMNMICRLQDENVVLKGDIESLCRKNIEVEKKKASIEDELSGSRERFNLLQYQLKTSKATQSQTLANYVKQLEKQVKELQQQNSTCVKQLAMEKHVKELQQKNIKCEMKVDALKLEKEALLTRLSEIAGKRLMFNNPGITDLSDEFRPLKLNDLFRELYDDKWTDAMEDLSSRGIQDKVAVTLLLEIVKEAFSLCKDSHLLLLRFPECQLLECVQESDSPQRKIHALDNKLSDEERTELRRSTDALRRKHHKYLIQACQTKFIPIVSELIQRRIQLCTSSGDCDVYKGDKDKLCEQHEQKGDFGKAVYKKATNIPETNAEYCFTPKKQKFTTGSNSLNLSNAAGKENIPDRKARSAMADFAKPAIMHELDSHVTEPSDITLDSDKFRNVLSFAEDVVEVCWWMRCTQPPVHLDFSIPVDRKFSPELYKAYTKSGQTIDYVVWPVMYLHEHGPMLSKGVAQPV